MKESRLLGVVCASLAAFVSLFSTAVLSTPILWEMNGTLSEGGTASGSFVYDADTMVFSDIILTTSASSPSGGLTFTEFLGDYTEGPYGGMLFLQSGYEPPPGGGAPPPPAIGLFLSTVYQADLTNEGGVLSLSPPGNPQAEVEMSFIDGEYTPVQTITNWDRGGGNALNAVPIPAAVWLFGSGMLGLIGIARRKKA